MRMKSSTPQRALVAVLLLAAAVACGRKQPPVARPTPPPPGSGTTTARPPAPPEPVSEQPIVPPEPVPEDVMSGRSLDELNRESPFQPVFFDLDSDELNAEGQQALQSNAGLMKKYPGWIVTVEGHCDQRGTAEYNLALGERRALTARNYLVTLGISADRLRTVSYGKEFPFDPGQGEAAWAKNRRAHFVITAK